MNKTINPFRLAMRVEGEWWNAYMAPPHTMDGATLLGSIRMTMVADPECKEAYLHAMRFLFSKAVENALGVPVECFETREAPEHEKAGRA